MDTQSDINAIFAKNLKSRRQALGLSQEALAHLTGLARTYISAVERGERNISLKNVQKIAAALNVPEMDLIRRSDDIS